MPQAVIETLEYLGGSDKVTPEFCETNWKLVLHRKVERCHYDDTTWWGTGGLPKELNPLRSGFYTWGQKLVRVCASGMLESNVLVFERR